MPQTHAGVVELHLHQLIDQCARRKLFILLPILGDGGIEHDLAHEGQARFNVRDRPMVGTMKKLQPDVHDKDGRGREPHPRDEHPQPQRRHA
ncbi:hypothetical protein D9M71_148720 [compost metagenome]